MSRTQSGILGAKTVISLKLHTFCRSEEIEPTSSSCFLCSTLVGANWMRELHVAQCVELPSRNRTTTVLVQQVTTLVHTVHRQRCQCASQIQPCQKYIISPASVMAVILNKVSS